MSQREFVEEQIREVLKLETQANLLSQKLFHPTGLFAQLASAEDERRAVARSALFAEAQHRLSELQRQEAAAFTAAVEQGQLANAENSLIMQVLGTAGKH